MTGQEVLELVKKCGSIGKAAKAAGVAKSTFQEWVKKAQRGANPRDGVRSESFKGIADACNKSKKVGRSLSDFRAAYDKDFIVPQRIRAGLKTLGGGWEYEVQFSRMAGVSMNDLGNYRDQFADYWHQIKADGRKVWSGSKAMIADIRKMV